MSLGCETGVVVAVVVGFGEAMGGFLWGRHVGSKQACLFLRELFIGTISGLAYRRRGRFCGYRWRQIGASTHGPCVS